MRNGRFRSARCAPGSSCPVAPEAAADIQTYLHPEDRSRLLPSLQKDHLLKELRKNGTVSIPYRQMLDGRYQYMNMQVVQSRGDERHIVIGVHNTDAQVRREQSIRAETRTFNEIAMVLAQNYEVIYHVNIHTDAYTEYSAGGKNKEQCKARAK